MELGWLSQLTALKKLLLNMNMQQARLHSSFVTLSSVTDLSLIGGLFKLDFAWAAFPALQTLYCNAVLGLTPHLVGLSSVRSLKEL